VRFPRRPRDPNRASSSPPQKTTLEHRDSHQSHTSDTRTVSLSQSGEVSLPSVSWIVASNQPLPPRRQRHTRQKIRTQDPAPLPPGALSAGVAAGQDRGVAKSPVAVVRPEVTTARQRGGMMWRLSEEPHCITQRSSRHQRSQRNANRLERSRKRQTLTRAHSPVLIGVSGSC